MNTVEKSIDYYRSSGTVLPLRRVFLVGCPRSGTTLLQSMLTAHSEIESFPETHFFDRLLGMTPRVSFDEPLQNPLKRIRRELVDLSTAIGFVPHRRAMQAWELVSSMPGVPKMQLSRPAWKIRNHASAFRMILDEMTMREGCRVWIEKTPDHLHFIPHIQRYIPDAIFVHIIRSGPDTVASLYDAAMRYPNVWHQVSSVQRAVKRWNVARLRSEGFRNRLGHLHVQYELLVEDPEKELKKICDFLQVEFQHQMARDYAVAAKSVIQENEPWKNGNMGSLRSTAGTKFYELFDEAQQKYVRENLIEFSL